MLTSMKALVDMERGFIDRNIFVDQDMYQQELEQIFGRCWLYVGHESQIAKPNDFVANYMGEDPVLVCRDSKGKIHAFLNMCRHRGNRICRADFGNAPSFMCTYHGWTFATDGRLVGVPGFKEAYFEELDRSQWGLVEVAQLETYKSLIFATWDLKAPSLLDYLGDMAWYMDSILDRRAGGTELLGGVYRWVQGFNWKMATDNQVGDSYHVPVTHGSRTAGGGTGLYRGSSWSVAAGNGHGMPGAGGGLGVPALQRAMEATKKFEEVAKTKNFAKFYAENPPENWPTLGNDSVVATTYYQETLPEARKRLGDFRAERASPGPCAIFPNFLHTAPSYYGAIRLMHPRGPMKTEEWAWQLIDKDTPYEVRNAMRADQTLTRGPSGIQEVDDAGNFIQSTASGKSIIGRRYLVNMQLGLGHEQFHEDLPGKVAPSPSEIAQRSFYARWAEIMDAPSWDRISIAPRTNP